MAGSAPPDRLQRSRRPAIAIMLVGPFLVGAVLIYMFGTAIHPQQTHFARGDQADIVMLDNGATALASGSLDGGARVAKDLVTRTNSTK